MILKKQILLCEDDEGIVEAVKLILEDDGYNVDIVSNNLDIVKYCEENQPQLILLDLWMPGINGKEIAEKLKQNILTKAIPIIILSANIKTADIAREVQADGFLTKPFDIEDLTSIVRNKINN